MNTKGRVELGMLYAKSLGLPELLFGLFLINNGSNSSRSLYVDSNSYNLIRDYKWHVSKKVICNGSS